MAFEPLQTDEKLSQPGKRVQDMDAAMLAGCSGFVSVSLLSYGLAVWPWFTRGDVNQIPGLMFCVAVGSLPSLAVGVAGTRKFGLAGACGFMGGALATAIFLYLRLQQIVSQRGDLQMPQPEYPDLWSWLVPLAWIAVVLLLIALTLPRGEFGPEETGKPTE